MPSDASVANGTDRSWDDGLGERNPSAGSNCIEVLLFSLGTSETFGINVFKVREVTLTPKITRTPHVPTGVRGVISLRGSVIPVIDLACVLGIEGDPMSNCSTLMVTEFCGRTQGFLVSGVERIARIAWDSVKSAAASLAGADAMVTAITRLPDGRLVSIVDVEQVLASAFGEPAVPDIEPIENGHALNVLFADDSALARREITQVLDKLGVRYQQATNGREAWDKLQALASQAHAEGTALEQRLRLVLTDAEMPEMDGYVLARNIRGDVRFANIPVVMHTSLSSQVNGIVGRSLGVDSYVAKFEPVTLAATLRPLLRVCPNIPTANPIP